MNESLQLILSALGNAVFNSIWQTGLLWLIVLVLTKVHKKLTPAQLSNISFAALNISFLLFIGTFITAILNPQAGHNGYLSRLFNLPQAPLVLSYSAILYLVLLTVPCFKFFAGLKNVYTLRHRGLGKASGQLRIFLSTKCQLLNIKRKVKIFTSTIATSPLTIGVFKPVILLPLALINQLTIQQIEAIILHEMAHIKRNDYLQNIISQIILCILYFNPFAQLLGKIQNLEREKSADQWVMQFSYNSHMYASTLFQLAQKSFNDSNKLAVPIAATQSNLLQRVQFIAGVESRKFPGAKALAFIFTGLFLSYFISSYFSPAGPSLTNSTTVGSFLPIDPRFASNIARDTPGGNKQHNDAGEFKEQLTATYPSSGKYSRKNPDASPIQPLNYNEFPENQELPNLQPTFVKEATIIIPLLPEVKEKNVRDAVATIQKAVVEMSWQSIDHSLAETVTDEMRQALKHAYFERLNGANWQNQADWLRLYYHQIDWDMAQANLALLRAQLFLDSLALQVQQRTFISASSASEPIYIKDSIHHLETLHPNEIGKQDSLRVKKIVAL